MNNSIEQINTK